MSIRNELLEQILQATQEGLGGSVLPADNFAGGFFDYNDAATSVTPISVLADTPTKLTNDTLGAFTTRAFAPVGVTDVWNSSTSQLDFSQLDIGDMVDIRLDITVTTTAPNQDIAVDLVLGIGDPSAYSIVFARGQVKTAGVTQASRFNGIYIGNALTRDNPGEFRITSDAPCSVVVKGWYIKVIKRGQ